MTHLTAIDTASRDRTRRKVRTVARSYQRDGRHLAYWMMRGRGDTIADAVLFPDDPRVTKRLCHALWDDYTTALLLPHWMNSQGRAMKISELRLLFACECWRYRMQRRAAMAQAAE
jgi:hypothetical protein